ncbi:MAG: hypothetical protein M3Q33_05770 [Acidobacteriota bacterium]|nr:hypothetical protein [Acidobacteriota bacterium]
MNKSENIVDDKGTTQKQAIELLNNLCREGFDDDVSRLALALGRPAEEIEDFVNGDETIDDDLVMKVRGIAVQRGINIE